MPLQWRHIDLYAPVGVAIAYVSNEDGHNLAVAHGIPETRIVHLGALPLNSIHGHALRTGIPPGDVVDAAAALAASEEFSFAAHLTRSDNEHAARDASDPAETVNTFLRSPWCTPAVFPTIAFAVELIDENPLEAVVRDLVPPCACHGPSSPTGGGRQSPAAVAADVPVDSAACCDAAAEVVDPSHHAMSVLPPASGGTVGSVRAHTTVTRDPPPLMRCSSFGEGGTADAAAGAADSPNCVGSFSVEVSASTPTIPLDSAEISLIPTASAYSGSAEPSMPVISVSTAAVDEALLLTRPTGPTPSTPRLADRHAEHTAGLSTLGKYDSSMTFAENVFGGGRLTDVALLGVTLTHGVAYPLVHNVVLNVCAHAHRSGRKEVFESFTASTADTVSAHTLAEITDKLFENLTGGPDVCASIPPDAATHLKARLSQCAESTATFPEFEGYFVRLAGSVPVPRAPGASTSALPTSLSSSNLPIVSPTGTPADTSATGTPEHDCAVDTPVPHDVRSSGGAVTFDARISAASGGGGDRAAPDLPSGRAFAGRDLRSSSLTKPPPPIIRSGSGGASATAGAHFHPPAAIGEWKLGRELGRGGFSLVHRGFSATSGRLFAVKIVRTDGPLFGGGDAARAAAYARSIMAEISTLRNLHHRRIVEYLGYQRRNSYLAVFLELVSAGSIEALLQETGPFCERVARRYMRQVLQGLEYLHSKAVVHGDIKGANVLVTPGGDCKLSDFGTAAVTSEHTDERPCGTLPYMSPETLRGAPPAAARDVWAVGGLLIEMLSGAPPWSELASEQEVIVVNIIQMGSRMPKVPEGASAEAYSFLSRCLVADPDKRATIRELTAHPWLSSTPLTASQMAELTSRASSFQLSVEALSAASASSITIPSAESFSSAGGGAPSSALSYSMCAPPPESPLDGLADRLAAGGSALSPLAVAIPAPGGAASPGAFGGGASPPVVGGVDSGFEDSGFIDSGFVLDD